MVLLAMRPVGGYFYNLGRETFLAPLHWEAGWPVACPGTGRVEFTYPAPDLPEQLWPELPQRDDFDSALLAMQWNFIRNPPQKFWSLRERPGFLRLFLRPERLSEQTSPSFIGRRQQHINFKAQVALEFTPQEPHELAGLALVQNNEFHFCLVMTGVETPVVRLIKRAAGIEEILAERRIQGRQIYLKIEAHAQAYSFYCALKPDEWFPVAEAVDGRILSTPVAGGFLGTYIGMLASSNGVQSRNYVDYDWFDYIGLDET